MNEKTLKERLRFQCTLALWQLILGVCQFILIIATFVLLIGPVINNINDNNPLQDIWASNFVTAIFLYMIVIVISIAWIVLWILGIINAVKINNLTNDDSVILIVFSILTFCFVHLIIAISQKHKYENYTINKHITTEEQDLRHAFTNGIISSSQYERKLKEIKNKK